MLVMFRTTIVVNYTTDTGTNYQWLSRSEMQMEKLPIERAWGGEIFHTSK